MWIPVCWETTGIWKLGQSRKKFLPSSWHVLKTSVSNLFLSPVFLLGQGAITLHCLQRTPDLTITLWGSQMAPKGSDSTDKWAPGPPSRWGERDRGQTREQRQQSILKLPSCGSILSDGLRVQPRCCLPPSVVLNWQGARNSRRKSDGNVLSSPSPLQSVWHCDYGHLLDSLWWSL